jgi:rhamnosyltransferase
MIRAGLVIVVHHPDADALDHVRAALALCPDATTVVDNTPSPDAGLHEQLRAEGLHVIDNGNRCGLAGAYNRGVAQLFGAGCDVVFLLDQDSDVEPGFVQRMTHAAQGLGTDAYLIGPRKYEIAMGTTIPVWATGSDGVRPLLDTDTLISSGSGVSRAAYEQAGPFRDDFFIEWIDIEYSHRCIRQGIARFVVTDETLRQHTGSMTRHLGGKYTTNHAAWRRYYMVRNGIWTKRRYEGGRAGLLSGLRFTLRELFVCVFFESDSTRKVLGIACGTLDGLRGNLGDLAELHPRVHRLVARSRRAGQ